MTNNTQLLPCPFCGGPGKLCVADYVPDIGRHPSVASVTLNNGPRPADVWNTRASAEDVRAVVEEPVAWTSVNTIGFLDKRRNEPHTAWRLNLSTHPLELDDVALYLRP